MNPATPEEMSARIEQVALPILRPIQTIDDFVAFASKERFPHDCLDLFKDRKVYVDVARGDFESAREHCAKAIDAAETAKVDWVREVSGRIAKTLCPLLAANDRAGLTQLLRECEPSLEELTDTVWGGGVYRSTTLGSQSDSAGR